jgi:hypothetical protein
MKRNGLLTVILFAVASMALATDRPQASSDPDSYSETGDSMAVSPSDQFELQASGKLDASHIIFQSRRGFEPDCMKMRTYVMARDEKGSDATHAVKYLTCVPAWKYEVRKADLPRPERKP